MSQETGVSHKVEEKVKRWHLAQKAVDRAHQELNSAQAELSNARNDLGKFLCPTDATKKEVFNIWYLSSLLSVTVDGDGEYSVIWRSLSAKDMLEL